MQTNTFPIQLNTNGAAPAQRNGASNGASSNGDGAQFSAMLSNEMDLRQPAPAPAPAPKAEAPKQAAAKPAQPDDAAAAQQAPKAEDAGKPADAGKAADADATDKADSQDEASEETAAEGGDPASAMLALMASLQQPVQDSKAGAAAQAYDALSGAAGKGKRGDAAQLAALQAAMKSVSKDGAGIATSAGKAFSDTAALRNPALAAVGAALGADDKPALALDTGAAGKPGVDLRAAFGAATGMGQAEAKLDAAELSLQQARDSALREPVPAAAALVQAQPAVMEAVQAAAAAAEGLSERVGTEAWEKQVGQKVVYMVGSEEQTASLTLNPPDLGPLQVVLSVTNDQASVTFSANQEEVRQALEDALPRLREMMSESGIALGNATVNAGMPDGRQAQEQSARQSRGFGNGRGRGDSGNTADDAAARPVARSVALGDRGMVDTFA
jgi:flagellar hook-length control protein FliK